MTLSQRLLLIRILHSLRNPEDDREIRSSCSDEDSEASLVALKEQYQPFVDIGAILEPSIEYIESDKEYGGKPSYHFKTKVIR